VTKRWLWSYARHGTIWALLACLALVLEPVGMAPQVLMFLIVMVLSVPIVYLAWNSGVSMYTAYLAVLLGLGATWLAVGLQRWRRGKPQLLLTIPHAVIAFLG